MSILSEDSIRTLIFDAFYDSQNSWRTIGGIARDTGLSIDTVASYIKQHADLFSKSPLTPGGSHLYRLRHNIESKVEQILNGVGK